VFDCDDLDKTYEDLKGKGVEFPVPPSVADWDGTCAGRSSPIPKGIPTD
jgi:hypothetical protein